MDIKLDDRQRRSYIKVNISPNQLIAKCVIDYPDESKQHTYTPEDIMAVLKSRHVIFGLKYEVIKDLANLPYGREAVVAEGKPKVNGTDAQLEYLINLGKLTPKELEDGRVDFFELNYVKNVVKGQILVRKIPAREGEPGMTVTGKRIEAISGRDRKLPLGKNTEISPNGLELRATEQGHVFVKNNKIMVENVFVIGRDVDISTGHIDFVGKVVIRGNVLDRIRITAKDDIEVYGDVGGAQLTSTEGNIKIAKAIFGRSSAVITAKKNISVKFVENARLYAGGDVIIQEYIIHSEVKCEGKIAVLGQPGILAGGTYTCVESLYTRDLGSEAQPKTNVEVNDYTAGPIQDEVSALSNERSVLKAKLVVCERALKDMRELTRREDYAALQRKNELAEVAQPYRYLYPQLCVIEEELEEKRKLIKTLGGPQEIVALGKIYPNVTVKLGPDELKVKATYDSKRFVLVNNKTISVRDVKATR